MTRHTLHSLVALAATISAFVFFAHSVVGLALDLRVLHKLQTETNAAHPGDPLVLRGLDVTGSAHTIVLSLNTTCPFVDASVPFLNDVIDTASETSRRISIAVVCPEPISVCASYLNSRGIRAKQVISANIQPHITPSIFILDRTSTITKLWRGQPDDASAKYALNFISDLR
jgi:hypothetical protein